MEPPSCEKQGLHSSGWGVIHRGKGPVGRAADVAGVVPATSHLAPPSMQLSSLLQSLLPENNHRAKGREASRRPGWGASHLPGGDTNTASTWRHIRRESGSVRGSSQTREWAKGLASVPQHGVPWRWSLSGLPSQPARGAGTVGPALLGEGPSRTSG